MPIATGWLVRVCHPSDGGGDYAMMPLVLLRLAYLGVTNVLALLRLRPLIDHDKDAEILFLGHWTAHRRPIPARDGGADWEQRVALNGAQRP